MGALNLFSFTQFEVLKSVNYFTQAMTIVKWVTESFCSLLTSSISKAIILDKDFKTNLYLALCKPSYFAEHEYLWIQSLCQGIIRDQIWPLVRQLCCAHRSVNYYQLSSFNEYVDPSYVLTNEAYQINLKTIRLLIHLRFLFSEEYFAGKDTTLRSNLKYQASNKRLRSLCCLRIHFYVVIFLSSGWHHSMPLLPRKRFYLRSFSYQPCNSTATEVPLRLIYT